MYPNGVGIKLIEAEPSNHPLAHVNDHIHLAAMVPSQVYETLRCDSECRKLKEIDNVIIGGVMGMATNTDNREQVLAEFRRLKEVFDSAKSGFLPMMRISGPYRQG